MTDLEAQLRRYAAVLDRAEPASADIIDAPTRVARRFLVVALAAAIVIAISAAAIVISATGTGNARRPGVVSPPSSAHSTVTVAPGTVHVLAIGDSVMLGAKVSLSKEMPGIAVDATLSRQFSQASAIVNLYRSSGILPNTVVVALGTNGAVSASDLDALMRAVGGRQVWFVTVRVPRAWESEVNDQLRALPARWRNAHVIDWNEYAGAHTDWFVVDGFHLMPAGQQAYSVLLASALGLLPKPAPEVPSGLHVVAVTEGQFAPVPLAAAGGEVWVAKKAFTATNSYVHLEGRDPVTTNIVAAIDVHQEAVFAIAGDGDSLWIAGGGDGGVPDTTVSLVNARTKSVVFTKTLTGTPCSCAIVAGSAGVWLVGNGSEDAIHLSSSDGHLLAVVPLPSKARASMAARGQLLVGLDDGRLARIDPVSNRVVGIVSTRGTSAPSTALVTAMAAAPSGESTITGYVTHADGRTAALFASTGQANEFLKLSFVPTAVADPYGFMWAFGGDRLEIQPTAGEPPTELAYESTRQRFINVAPTPATQLQGFREAVSVGGKVWVVYDDGVARHDPSIVVIDAPAVQEG